MHAAPRGGKARYRRRRGDAILPTVSQLVHREDDGDARCSGCGRIAVGPCARCEAPVCGDCCTLVEGAANTYAVCLPCSRHSGAVGSGWRLVLGWIVVPILLLLGAVVVLFRLTAR